jgi:hypothetical protein
VRAGARARAPRVAISARSIPQLRQQCWTARASSQAESKTAEELRSELEAATKDKTDLSDLSKKNAQLRAELAKVGSPPLCSPTAN